MESLDKYANHFDASYPAYADARYLGILALVSKYDSDSASTLLASESFKQALDIILPVIAIKNYKSQIPFPEDVLAVVETVLEVRGATIDASDRFKNLTLLFNRLEATQGFQLPTISAVFHFCHPESFPIVDVNVQAACKALIDRNPELAEYEYPKLPAPRSSVKNKIKKYKLFIAVIDKILDLHREKNIINNYRCLDKALMVLGALQLKKTTDAVIS
ncbi:hypothetical protein [Pseudomonas sp. Irchel s3f10]|uniref:hypothetical protein n=1 Tax=Pseudomonas sp. Irchel s3f10 TaxID=2009137 RepID=UPI000BA3C672|nr:hypothetical protein [Pseudomonas sp. Irchel s3f10]